MTILQGKGCLLVGKAELLSPGPEFDHIGRRDAGLDGINGNVEQVATVFIGIHHRLRGATNGKGAIVAGAIAVVAVQDVEIGRVAWTQCAIAEYMGMRTTALAGD